MITLNSSLRVMALYFGWRASHARQYAESDPNEVKSRLSRSVSLREFLRLGRGAERLATFDDARQFYVDYHALLADAGIYSCAGILFSAARAVFNPASDISAARTELVLFDGASASGLRTIENLGLKSLIDIRPRFFFSHVGHRERWRFVTRLANAVRQPERFFQLLFDAYVSVTRQVLDRNPECRRILAANERSLGCAPCLAAAKFLHEQKVIVIQHGNPIGDFLPTLADEYWCRSDRWFRFLGENAIVPELRRIADFPVLDGVEYNPDCRRAVLVMHNVGYLEPDLNYRELSRKINDACSRAGWTLHALRHPANPECYGLPLVDRGSDFKAALGIGFRSTATDQLPSAMARVSLLDYWPDFFLREGSERQLDDYLRRIDEALT